MNNVTRNDVWELAKSRRNDLVKLASDLIRIPSENPVGTQRDVIDFVEKYLSDAGISYEEVSCNPDHPNVLAKMGSDDGFSVILNGHVDVVPAGDRSQWDYDPFGGEITDKRILGRGASDMKAGVAGLLFAMKVLKDSGADLKGNIRLHIVSDEESGSEYGFVNRATLKEPMQPLLRNRQPTGPSNPDRKATCILSSNPSASLPMEALAITRVIMLS